MNTDFISRICLVITSSVYPSSNFVKIVNPVERERQYISSILFYISRSSVVNIVVCDNSGFNYNKYDLLNLAKLYNKNLELLSFKGNYDLCFKLGKGYGEGEILEYIYNNSLIFSDCDFFFKVTGRIIISNFDKIFYRINPEFNYFNFIRHMIFFRKEKIDTRFYFSSKFFFKNNLFYRYKNVLDSSGYFLEHSYFVIYDKFEKEFYEFPVIIQFSGFSGSNGNVYDESTLKYFLKNLLKFIKLI